MFYGVRSIFFLGYILSIFYNFKVKVIFDIFIPKLLLFFHHHFYFNMYTSFFSKIIIKHII